METPPSPGSPAPPPPLPPPAPGAGEKKGLPRWAKWLIGCGAGCAVLIVVAVVALVLGWMWLMAPGEQVPTDRIIGPRTTGVVRLGDAGEDEGTRDLLVSMMRKWRRAARSTQAEDLPESMQWLRNMEATPGGGSNEDIAKMLPSETTLVLEPGDGGPAPLPALAINLKMLPRLIEMMLGLFAPEEKVRTETEGEQEFRVFEGGASLAFVGGTIVWTRTDGLMRDVLRRIETAEGGDGANAPAFAGPEGGAWDVTGAFLNRDGALPFVVHRYGGLLLPPKEDPDAGGEAGSAPSLEKLSERMTDVEALRVGLDAVSEDLVEGKAVLTCASAEAADAWLARVRKLMPDMIARLEGFGLTVEASADVAGRDVATTFRLGRVGRGLDTLTEAVLEQARVERRGSPAPDRRDDGPAS